MTERPFALIAHSWATRPHRMWFQHAGGLLEKAGFVVAIPNMPKTKTPDLEEWLGVFDEAIGNRKGITMITHSISGRVGYHYMQRHPDVVRNFIGVATYPEHIPDLTIMEERFRGLYAPAPNLQLIKTGCPNMVGFYSEDDPVIPFSQTQVFKERLGGRVLRYKDQGHFTGDTLPLDADGNDITAYLK